MSNLFSFNKVLELNKNLILSILVVFSVGIFTLYSASGGNFAPWAEKQLYFFIFFAPIMALVIFTNINIWYKVAYPIYFASLILLVYVEFMGHTAMGATRWIRFMGFSLQPSETIKLGLVIGLARYFSKKNIKQIQQDKHLIIPVLMIIAPVLLVLKQPDLGTALILLAVGSCILFVVGVQWWRFAICFALVLLVSPIVWKYGLHDYQRRRVEVFINPESDPLGSGYNIAQSKIAIGSGGFFGKGYMKGTQSHLYFLPEKQTDFIFTMATEEIGFVGGVFIIFMYLLISGFIFWTAFKSRHTFNRIIISGVGAILFFHVFVNIGMVMGILPVVGVPLLLMSYGGTSIVVTMISFSFLLNADLYRDEEIK